MAARWNPPTPITDLLQQLNDREDFLEEGIKIINNSILIFLILRQRAYIRTFQRREKNLVQKNRNIYNICKICLIHDPARRRLSQ